jgi:HK97 family phage portal protein
MATRLLPTDWRRDPVAAGVALAAATATLEAQKAASLAVGPERPTGYWAGDPITSGQWVDTRPYGAWRSTAAFDYERTVGKGDANSIVRGCLRAIAEAAQEPPLRVYRPNAEGELDKQPDTTPLARLLRHPNPAMPWKLLARWVAVSLHVHGNAYLWKARSSGGRVVGLWPRPATQVWPVGGPTTARWITHYAYKPDDRREPLALPVEDVVHLRLELDDGMLLGRAPLRDALKHVFTDEEATIFLNALLKNYAGPGVILSPDPAAEGGGPDQAQADKIKARFAAALGGDHRGEPLVLGGPMRVTPFSFNPQQMQFDTLLDTPETRICAVLGVPPIIALLNSGLKQATYSNAEQFQSGFVNNKMVPYWALLDDLLTDALVPEFYGEDAEHVLKHDLTDVRALQEDEHQRYERLTNGLKAGALLVNEWRRELGFPDLDEGDVLLIPTGNTPTDPAALLPEPEPEPAPVPPALGPGPGVGQVVGMLEAPVAAPPVNGLNNQTNGRAR